MTTTPVPRRITVERTTAGRFSAANDRGGRISFGTGDDTEFTPTELLLAAIGGCTGIDVDILTSRRAEPESFAIEVAADKVRDDEGNRLTDIMVTFRIAFPAGRLGRTVELGTPIATRIEDASI